MPLGELGCVVVGVVGVEGVVEGGHNGHRSAARGGWDLVLHTPPKLIDVVAYTN